MRAEGGLQGVSFWGGGERDVCVHIYQREGERQRDSTEKDREVTEEPKQELSGETQERAGEGDGR